MRVDKFDRPTSCEISQVSALETDPGHALWRAMRTPMSDETRAAISRMASNLIMSDGTRAVINRIANIARYWRSGGGADGPQQPGSEPDSGSSGQSDIADKGARIWPAATMRQAATDGCK